MANWITRRAGRLARAGGRSPGHTAWRLSCRASTIADDCHRCNATMVAIIRAGDDTGPLGELLI